MSMRKGLQRPSPSKGLGHISGSRLLCSRSTKLSTQDYFNARNLRTRTELSPGIWRSARRRTENQKYLPDELNNHFLSSAYSSARMLPVWPTRLVL